MIEFKQAIRDESLRQAYLDQFLEMYPCKSIVRLVYNKDRQSALEHVKRLSSEGIIDDMTAKEQRAYARAEDSHVHSFMLSSFIGKDLPTTLFVNKKLFEELSPLAAASILAHHEYQHTQDYQNGIELPGITRITYRNIRHLGDTTLEDVLETRADAHQLDQLSLLQQTDTPIFRATAVELMKYHRRLRENPAFTNFDMRVKIAQMSTYANKITLLRHHGIRI